MMKQSRHWRLERKSRMDRARQVIFLSRG